MAINRTLTILFLTGIAILPAGCATTGTGEGDMTYTDPNNQLSIPVKFSWKSSDKSQRGIMTATLDNDIYQGPFFQITSQTNDEILAPLWDGWETGWEGWPYEYNDGNNTTNYVTTEYITQYTGKVVANLKNTSEQRMRCRFYLDVPTLGLSGGGEGQCQLTGGRNIDVVLDASLI